jgi:hypothetical protein
MEQLTELLNQYSIFGLPEQTGLLSFGTGSGASAGEPSDLTTGAGSQGFHCPVHGALNSTSGFGPLRKQRSQQLHPLRANTSGAQLRHQHSASAAFAPSHSPPADLHAVATAPLPTAQLTIVDVRPDVNNNHGSSGNNLTVAALGNEADDGEMSSSSLDSSSAMARCSDKDRFPSDRSDSVDCAGCLCNDCGCVERMLYLEKHWRSLVASHGNSLPNRLQNQQDAIWELLSTELFYIRRLKVVSDLFLNCLCNLQGECLLNDVRRPETAFIAQKHK